MYTGGAPLSMNSYGPAYEAPLYGQWPFNRHIAHRTEDVKKNVTNERSRVVMKGGKRIKVPVSLQERPDWDSTKKRNAKFKDWSSLERIAETCKALVSGRHVEARLHAAFAIARCSNIKENREPLALTPGVIEAISHTLLHSEPSESGRRCQLHVLTTLHNVLLESPKIDMFFGHDEGILGGLLHCLGLGDLSMQEIAITCMDFLSISKMNQDVMVFKPGLLDAVANLCRTTHSGYALYHALHTLTYLCMCERAHSTIAHHDGTMGVLRDVLLEHDTDPQRCQQGLIALCYLASQQENAFTLVKKHGLAPVLLGILRESRDKTVLEISGELAARMQIGGVQPSWTAPTPRRVSFSQTEDVANMEEGDVRREVFPAVQADFTEKWNNMREEVMKRPMPVPVESDETLALLDKYEAELNAAMAELEIGSADKRQAQQQQLHHRELSPPRPPVFAALSLGDSDEEQSHHPNQVKGGRYGLGTFAIPRGHEPHVQRASSPSGIGSDMWSVSGESDI